MQKKRKKIMVCVLALVLVFACCGTAWGAGGGGGNDVQLAVGKKWTASAYRTKADSSAKAVFNAKDYNSSTKGYIKTLDGKSSAVQWGMEYHLTNSTTHYTSLAFKMAYDGIRNAETMSANYLNAKYRLLMKNSGKNAVKIKASYTPG